MNQPVGSAFDKFKKSLPKDMLIGDDYRLEVAWKLYGLPQDYEHALWEGLIQPINEVEFKLPSIGYNEETDEYEYLNKGEDNETVAKDIRVWDNDVIPLVQELKLGGYVRTFNKEKDCWTYTKNSLKKEEPALTIEAFKEGGKSKRNKTDLIIYANQSKIPFMQRILNNDLRKLDLHNGKHATHMLGWGESDGKTYVYPRVLENEYKLLLYYKFPEALNRAIKNGNVLEMTPEEAEWFTKNYKWFYPNYFGSNPYPNSPQAFKQGGAVIPSGSLHAHKNHMQLASEGLITPKGIPVVSEEDGEIQLLAEIEREEVIFDKQATTDIEKLYKKFNETDKLYEKDELAIKAGKILTDIFINNTEDNTGLIEKVADKNSLEYTK